MAFFKFRSRGPQGNEGRNSAVAGPPAESIEAMRRRARQRLLGAAVLVLIGVVGFPLLFDTQPRPIAVDIPIEIPDRTKAKPLVLPAAPAPAPAPTSGGGKTSGATVAPANDGIITEAADGTELPPGKVAALTPAPEIKSEPVPEPDGRSAPRPEAKPEPKPEPKPKTEAKAEAKPAAPKPAPTDDGARARALLEGKTPTSTSTSTPTPTKPAAADESGRFVVQVGAFADLDKAREVRQKLEKAGFKTYTNVARTADGERTRVRVGPFGTRAEADRAAGRVKGLSLPAAVLSL
jgi:DedD protein